VTPEKSTNPVIHHPLEVNSLISFSPDSPMLHPSTRKETNKVGTPSTTPFSRLQRLPNYLSATFLILVLTCIEISGLSSSPKQDSPEKREYWCPKMPTRYEPHTEIPVFDERQFRDAFFGSEMLQDFMFEFIVLLRQLDRVKDAPGLL
jgi:hypothetical protein